MKKIIISFILISICIFSTGCEISDISSYINDFLSTTENVPTIIVPSTTETEATTESSETTSNEDLYGPPVYTGTTIYPSYVDYLSYQSWISEAEFGSTDSRYVMILRIWNSTQGFYTPVIYEFENSDFDTILNLTHDIIGYNESIQEVHNNVHDYLLMICRNTNTFNQNNDYSIVINAATGLCDIVLSANANNYGNSVSPFNTLGFQSLAINQYVEIEE